MRLFTRQGRILLLTAMVAVVMMVWLLGCSGESIGEALSTAAGYGSGGSGGGGTGNGGGGGNTTPGHTHTWGDWVVTTEATCDASGVETRTCTQNASHTETRAISKLNCPEIDMIYVQGGTFTMGCTSEQGSDCNSDESPSHSVTLSSYYIGKYEVTQGLWMAVMDRNPGSTVSGRGDNYPVYSVTWNEVQTFIQTLNSRTGKRYRLPTEAEWEYAARGGNKSNRYKYSGSNTLSSVAWYGDNSGSAHPVGTKSPNELGIYDMSGNVWEWVNDWKSSYSSSSQTNPTGPSSGSNRVFRGGSWNRDARYGRVSFRNSCYPDCRYNDLGFRLAVSP